MLCFSRSWAPIKIWAIVRGKTQKLTIKEMHGEIEVYKDEEFKPASIEAFQHSLTPILRAQNHASL